MSPLGAVLKEYLQQHGIKLVLLDLDGTLIDTVSVFRQQISLVYAYLSSLTGLTPHELDANFKRCIKLAKKYHFVNPEPHWRYALKLLAARLQQKNYELNISTEHVESCLKLLMEIYRLPIPLLPGADEFLSALQECDVELAIVTHAEPHWTEQKLAHAGLQGLWDSGSVYCVPVNGPKSAEEWRKVTSVHPNISFAEILVGGDDFFSDIMPTAGELGIRHAIWLRASAKAYISIPRHFKLPEDQHLLVVENWQELTGILTREMPLPPLH